MHSIPSKVLIALPPSRSKMLTSLSLSFRNFSSPFCAFQETHSSTVIAFSALVSVKFDTAFSLFSLATEKTFSRSTAFHGNELCSDPIALRLDDELVGVLGARGTRVVCCAEGEKTGGLDVVGRDEGGLFSASDA